MHLHLADLCLLTYCQQINMLFILQMTYSNMHYAKFNWKYLMLKVH